MKSAFVFAALFTGYAAAQSACIVQCSTEAATANCNGAAFSDPACACENTAFQQATLTCIQSTCPDDAAQALQLQGALCGATSGSASQAPTASVTASESASETETEPEATGTASSASVPPTATAPGSSTRAATSAASNTSRASASSGSSVSRTASGVSSPSTTVTPNAASVNLATNGVWAAAALGGAVVAQLVL